ncbi:MAG: hypothetical protein HQ483_08095 [Rhodospirillales bacterium]|nr:hypothetical protein [Rhodospirillales bacterium]
MKLKRLPLFLFGFVLTGVHVVQPGPLLAASLTGSVSVTIGSGGGVGATTPPATTTATAPVVVPSTSVVNANGTVTTAVGDPVAIQTSTFRALAPVPAPAAVSGTPSASSSTTTSGASASAAQQRFSAASRQTANLFGGASSVSVSGVPNQTYNISLPGKTTYSAGGETVNIGGFAHNAGATPQLGAAGAGTFSVAAQVNEEAGLDTAGGASEGDSNEEDLGDVADVGSVQQILATPVVTRSPFVSIIVSYN